MYQADGALEPTVEECFVLLHAQSTEVVPQLLVSIML